MRVAVLDELDVLAKRLIEETENLPPEQKRKHITDEVYELLVLAYIYGIDRVQRQDIEGGLPRSESEAVFTALERSEQPKTEEIPYKTEDLYRALYKPVAGETFEERISRRIQEGTLDRETLRRILETDYHRMEETGAYDRAVSYSEETGLLPYKVWQTMRDDRVRDTHQYIEGVEVPLDAWFYTYDSDTARFPGDFELPENNIGCRCWLRYTFK